MIGGALAVTGIVLAWLLSIGLGIILLVIGIILAAVSLVSVTYL
jgi:cell division protein FtsL